MNTKLNTLIELGKILGMAVIMAFVMKTFIFMPTLVDGASMNPTLNHGDFVILEKYKVLITKNFKMGDIVVMNSPKKDGKHYIKRVIAVEGDTINIVDGKVYINGEIIDEKYIHSGVYTQSLKHGENYTVPNGEIYVIGDNRNPFKSSDSREFGSISVNEVIGKVSYRIYPKISKIK